MSAEKEKSAEGDVVKSKMGWSLKFAIFVLMVICALFFPSTVLFCGGMLPTLVAAIVDDRPQKTAWVTVGAINFAGIVPIWFQLWQIGHTLENALGLLMQPKTLIMAYGSAAIGWSIYYHVPSFVAGILARRSEKRLKDIEKRKKELARKWGPEVSGE